MERDLIRSRTAEGRSRAKAQGKHMGPAPVQQKEAIRRRARGATLQELARVTTSAAHDFPPHGRDHLVDCEEPMRSVC